MHMDLLMRLSQTPKHLAQLVVEVGEDGLDASQAGGWSARTTLAHLRDIEWMLFRLRLERMLAEDGPTFALFDAEAWAAARNRARDRREELLADFALQRQATLAILRSLGPAGWAREGRSPGGRQWTVEALVRHYAAHDAEHLAQIEEGLGTTLDEVLRRRYHPPA
jgi:hypothetical protein